MTAYVVIQPNKVYYVFGIKQTTNGDHAIEIQFSGTRCQCVYKAKVEVHVPCIAVSGA